MLYHLLEWVAGLKRIDVLAEPARRLEKSDINRFIDCLERLSKGEPLQHITGTSEFYGLDLKVNPDVLIPRPETEELIRWISDSHNRAPDSILDIGTGSGCIALALASVFKDSNVWATDSGSEALEIARENAQRNHLAVEFALHDALSGSDWPGAPHDVVVSNPPYIDPEEHSTVAYNVLGRDPDAALFSPPGDALAFYRIIAESAGDLLMNGGALYFELHEIRAQAVEAILEDAGFQAVEIRKDLNGKWRMARGIWIGG